MIYLGPILQYLLWPFMIVVSYLAVRWALKRFERKWSADNPRGK